MTSLGLYEEWQEELEAESYNIGRKRLVAFLKEQDAATMPSDWPDEYLSAFYLFKVEGPIERAIDLQGRATQRGHKNPLRDPVAVLGAHVVAYVTLVEIVGRIAEHTSYSAACMRIADRLGREAANRGHSRESVTGTCDDPLEEEKQWITLGHALISIAQHVGLVEVTNKRHGKGKGKGVREEKLVHASSWSLDNLSRLRACGGQMLVKPLPMVETPTKWERSVRGGYKYERRQRYSIVKNMSKQYRNAVEQSLTPVVFDALNGLQATDWKINGQVLNVAQAIAESGSEAAGIVEIPVKPERGDLPSHAWRRVKDEWKNRKAKATKARTILAGAERLKGAPAIYFPMSLDFRGRIYPIPNPDFSPIGPDLGKGLLTFAHPKPLGDMGEFWLKVHGARLLGTDDEGVKLDRMPFRDRAAFIDSIEDRLRAVVQDPLGMTWWQDKDDPFQLLAFCFELDALCSWRDQGERVEDFLSCLPVHMDGSCNALQHYSAMFRDEVTGASVNLLEGDAPLDHYSNVLRELEATVTKEAAVANPHAVAWAGSGLLDRKLVKGPAMTDNYGATDHRILEVVQEHVKGALTWEDCYWLTRRLREALNSAAPAARSGRLWLEDRAKRIARKGHIVEWVVPVTGFRVRQARSGKDGHFKINKGKRIPRQFSVPEFVWEGDNEGGETLIVVDHPYSYKPASQATLETIDQKKQSTGVAANVIHSLDAAALMLTIQAAFKEGITCFAAVHDSYGTHAGDTEKLRRITREQFVRLYSRDVAADLERQFLEQAGDATDELVPMPEQGTLDIRQVLKSPYFFG